MPNQDLSPGDSVILLCGSYNPAHMGYFRAIEAISKRPGVSEVWVTPISKREEVPIQDMCTIMATECRMSAGLRVACCLYGIGTDRCSTEKVKAWCSRHHPGLNFKTAQLYGEQGSSDIEVRFSGRGLVAGKSGDVIFLSKILPVKENLVQRIQAGIDESRSFLGPVWEYIQKYKLYRS